MSINRKKTRIPVKCKKTSLLWW